MSAPAPSRKVLVVDDDPVALFITNTHLTKVGYRVLCAESVSLAREMIEESGFPSFSAIISDYRMPGENGLALLEHVQAKDSTLALIMVTAEGEKSLVANSLRGGAVDFLDKPVSGQDLLDAVARACEMTEAQRSQRSALKEVSRMAHSQRMLLGQSTAMLGDRFRLYFRPHEKAGGDFVAAYPLDETRFVVLVSDVSGHDAQAAYRSAYLQGFARALLGRGTSIDDTFIELNNLLLNEWNVADDEILSLAACATCVDTASQSLSILNCGLPTPFLVEAGGWARPASADSTTALGWFKDIPRSLRHEVADHRIFLWSDGVEDLAERLGCDPLSLAFRLNSGVELSGDLFEDATDDIISVQFDLSPEAVLQTRRPLPLLSRSYAGATHKDIDGIQLTLERSLFVAFPTISAQVLHDCIICVREALLNALMHGCQGAADRFAELQMIWDPVADSIFVRIRDDGTGHHFDISGYDDMNSKELIPEHHGLLMIKYLTKSVSFSPAGNVLTMEFSVQLTQ